MLAARPAASDPPAAASRPPATAPPDPFGRPLASDEESEERLTKVKALAVFSSDNLSSVAYATEAIMFTLLAAGTAAFWLTMPISVLIVAILGIIVVSYRQTIRAYPNGGGSYIVAQENLGHDARPGRRGGAPDRLRPDRLGQRRCRRRGHHLGLPGRSTTSVSISAAFILVVMLVNLRGIRESGTIFALPTYVFLVTTLALIGIGVARTLLGDPPHVTGVMPSWCRSSPSGCCS